MKVMGEAVFQKGHNEKDVLLSYIFCCIYSYDYLFDLIYLILVSLEFHLCVQFTGKIFVHILLFQYCQIKTANKYPSNQLLHMSSLWSFSAIVDLKDKL